MQYSLAYSLMKGYWLPKSVVSKHFDTEFSIPGNSWAEYSKYLVTKMLVVKYLCVCGVYLYLICHYAGWGKMGLQLWVHKT